jgi:hypothetical protein
VSENEELLRELIQATDRTTRAVRAFVRFLFIQLAAITLAFFVFQLGVITQDPSECAFGVCSPNGFTTILAALIWAGGVIWSSIAGWDELERSSISTHVEYSGPQNLASSEVGAPGSCGNCGTKSKPGAAYCEICMRPIARS